MVAEPKHERSDGFRVVYLGTQQVIGQLSSDFRRLGVLPVAGIQGQGEAFVLSKALARRLPQAIAGHELSAPATVYFSSDLFQVVNHLPQLEPDLIILDERPVLAGRRGGGKSANRSSSGQEHGEDSSQTDTKMADVQAEVLLAVQPSELHGGSTKPPLFEDFRSALKSFSPRDFHYPMRRVLVILPEAEDNQVRA
ncbi:MAG: hypothetical protein RI953_111, partial [Pseudomonadota bacterium]